jgi:hypothetical protein
MGHLECYFDCGRSFDSLEALALHIDVGHREDNEISPFVIRESPPRESPVTEYYPPAEPLRAAPPVPPSSGGGFRSKSFLEILCSFHIAFSRLNTSRK